MLEKLCPLILIILWISLSNTANLIAQSDSALTNSKTKAVFLDTTQAAVHSPKKAAIYSAVLPGAGQVYNKKYWKVGVIAAGAGGLVYATRFNQNNYNTYKSELIKRQQNQGGYDSALDKYTDANLLELQNYYRRFRDLSLIGIVFLYVLNIVDATVDAHLMNFDIGTDLSLQVRPQPVYSAYRPFPIPGLGLTLGF
jgi:hypothetical protein